jgi:tetratricopeptide (TPR) repeat protein
MRSVKEAAALHELALDFAGQKRLSEAIEKLRDAIAIRPDYVDARYSLARILADTGRHEDAVEAFDDLLQLIPAFGQGHFEKGLVLVAADRRREGIEAFREALRINPADVYSLNHLALALRADGAIEESVLLLRRAIDHRPEMEEAYHNLTALLAAQERWSEAEDLLRRGIDAMARPASRSRLYLDLAGILEESGGHLSEIKKAFTRAIEVDPASADARLAFGGFLSASGDVAGAERLLQQVADDEPDNARAHCALGATLVDQGRHEEALRRFQRAPTIDERCLGTDPEWQRSYEMARDAVRSR